MHKGKVTIEGIQLMERMGGSFVRTLAEAWHHADPENKEKLASTFSYFEEYSIQAKEMDVKK